jgi:hypothetical protein
MLGFSTISEGSFSEASLAILALAYLPSSLSQGLTGALFTDAKAYITTSSVASTSSANALLYDSKASILFADAVAAFDTNALLNALAKANVTPSSSVATFSTGVLDYNSLAHITPTGTSSQVLATDLADVDAKANTSVAGTQATGQVEDFLDVYGKASVVPSTVSAFLTIYIGNFADEDAQARAFIPPAVSAASVSVVDFDAKANITTSSAAASLVGEALTPYGKAIVSFDSVFATLFRNLEDPVAVRFPYQDYADQYAKGRVLFVTAYDKDFTAHIAEQDNTVYINRPQGSNTVHIAEQDNTVYIDKPQGNNTVYIAA